MPQSITAGAVTCPGARYNGFNPSAKEKGEAGFDADRLSLSGHGLNLGGSLRRVRADVAACTATATVTPTATAVPPQPSSTPPPATVGHLVSGLVLDSSTSLLLGGEVRLEPLGMAATTVYSDGSFQIIGVPDGTYQVTVLPQCVAYGCYSAQVLVVSGSDETEFNLAPVPAVVLPSGPRRSGHWLGPGW